MVGVCSSKSLLFIHIFCFEGPGVLVCSIDNMPTQIPRESTDFFGELLYPFALDILQSDATKPLESHSFCPAVSGVSKHPNFYVEHNAVKQLNVSIFK